MPSMKQSVSAAMRARDVSRPRPEHMAQAEAGVPAPPPAGQVPAGRGQRDEPAAPASPAPPPAPDRRQPAQASRPGRRRRSRRPRR